MRRGSSCALLLVLVATVAACRTSQTKKADSEPRELADALSFEEQTRRGEENPISSERHLGLLDRRSQIKIDPDPDKLKQLAAGKSGHVIVPLSPEEEKALKSSRQLLDSLTEYVDLARRVDAEVSLLRQEGPEALAAARSDLEASVQARARRTFELVSALEVAVADFAKSQGYSLERDEEGEYLDLRAERFIEKLEDDLLPNGEAISVTVATELLEFRMSELEKRVVRDREAIEDVRSAQKLILLANLINSSGEKTRLHVQNYDTLDTGGGNAPKTLLGIPESRWKEIQKRFELSANWARFFNDLRDRDSDLRQRLRNFSRELRTKLGDLVDGIAERFESIEIDGLEKLADSLQQNGASSELVSRVRDLGVRFTALRDEFEAFRKEIDTARKALEDQKFQDIQSVYAMAQSFAGLPTKLTKMIGSIEGIAKDIAGIKAPIDTWVAGLTPAVKQQIDQLWDAVQGFAIDSIRDAVPIFDDYPAVATLIQTVAGQLRVDGFLLGLSESSSRQRLGKDLPEDTIARPIDEVLPGTVDLDGYASPGDRLEITALLQGPDGTQTPLAEHRQKFEVIGRGFYPTLESHVIFANRQGRGEADIINGIPVRASDPSFQAAPAVSWTMHYRKEEETVRADDWAACWNFLDPGLGINVAALNFESDSVEIGVGGHLTFFGDLLEVGYGWNLSVSDSQEYFFLGIGIIEALNVAGLGNFNKTP